MSSLREFLSADVSEQEQQSIEDKVQSYLQLVQKVCIAFSFCSRSLSVSPVFLHAHTLSYFLAAFSFHVCSCSLRSFTFSVCLICRLGCFSCMCMCECTSQRIRKHVHAWVGMHMCRHAHSHACVDDEHVFQIS